jgi:3-oxoacyl-(acyl-carrier-protein) synthase/NAD(P)-dependent dehydrogenase (short-subunit alcohol dehydrogenase family)/acyl carrier protein
MRYLLVVRDRAEGTRIAAALDRSDEAIVVCPGTGFTTSGDGFHTVDPGASNDYARLLSSLPDLPDRVLYAWPLENGSAAAQQTTLSETLAMGVEGAFLLVQALLALKPASPVILLYVFARCDAASVPAHDAFGAFARTVTHESRKVICKLVSLSCLGPAPLIAQWPMLCEEFANHLDEPEVRYLDDRRQRRIFREVTAAPEPEAPLPIKDGGVYLISGGSGGLGHAIACHIASRYRAGVALFGRRAKDRVIANQLDELDFLGASPVYHAADIADPDSMRALVANVRRELGPINGIIHGAGIQRDALIVNKSLSDFRDVLRPKIQGTLCLDSATLEEPLDFVLYFSSIAGLLGNMGQADYSYANSFLDHFALQRSELVRAGSRRGRTMSINWPLWEEGGMRVDEQVRILAERALGMAPLATSTGLRLLEMAMRIGAPQLFVGTGDRRKIGKWFGFDHTASPAGEQPTPAALPPVTAPGPALVPTSEGERALRALQDDLIAGVVEILQVDPKDAEIDTDLNRFGFDSLTFTTFGNRLAEALKVEISPVVFFEYQTIRELSTYLFEEHNGAILAWYARRTGNDMPTAAPPVPQQPAEAVLTAHVATTPIPASPDRCVPAPRDTVVSQLEPIAIIGIDGMLPQSADLEIFWANLIAGQDLVSEVPPERWDWQAIWGDPFQEKNKTRIKWGGFIPDVDKFDAAFFGISAREAELMDPQHRLFLQAVWRCIEDAGYRVSNLTEREKVGIFCGSASIDYHDILARNDIDIDVFAVTGTMFSVLVNRISYLLNFRGPSEPVETACSSSLVAVHRAMQSIRAGECDVAIAGAVHLMLGPNVHIGLDKGGFLSQQGRCATFDKDADGYVRGEGCIAVLLKPLSRAEADGDHIHAVIRGSAVNHGGRVNTLTTPNPNAQTEVIVEAWKQTGVDPRTIGYIEAHGTGTALGDPIEVKALRRAFDELYGQWGIAAGERDKHCGLGSVKSNIGHLEFAAGISGLAKVIMALRHRTLPASIHFNAINPYINLDSSPFFIADSQRPWVRPRGGSGQPTRLRAGVSSFGFGGVNCHVAVEEYTPSPTVLPPTQADRPQAIVLSAKSSAALAAIVDRLRAYLDQTPDAILGDIAYTLAGGREAMPERMVVVANNIRELKDRLYRGVARLETGQVFRGSKQAGGARLSFLKSRDEAVRFARTIIAQNNLEEMAGFWVDGLDLDWTETEFARGGRRIPLPTYPFARTRHWIEARPPSAAPPDDLNREVIEMLNAGLLTEAQARELLSV